MEKKRLTMLILGGMITAANGEDFINAERELKSFSSQYDFGTPIGRESDVLEASRPPEATEDGNNTPEAETVQKADPKQELRKDLNITCGAKCGISFKKEDNNS
jgi:hypothetical protein